MSTEMLLIIFSFRCHNPVVLLLQSPETRYVAPAGVPISLLLSILIPLHLLCLKKAIGTMCHSAVTWKRGNKGWLEISNRDSIF